MATSWQICEAHGSYIIPKLRIRGAFSTRHCCCSWTRGVLLQRVIVFVKLKDLHFRTLYTGRQLNPYYLRRESCPCARHDGMWEGGGIASLILNIGIKLRSAVDVRLRPFSFRQYTLKYPLNNCRVVGLREICGCFGGEINILPPTAVEPRSLGCEELNIKKY